MASIRELFLRYQAQTTPSPLALEVERAESCHLITPDGRHILDLIAGISVSNLGHGYPAVLDAVRVQIERHAHLLVYGEAVQAPQALLAQALVESTDGLLDNVFFTNSGTEATEGALKLAKRYTGRPDVVACLNAYHGSTHGALSAGGGAWLKEGFGPLVPGFRHIRFGVPDDLELINRRTAAFLVETVQGEAGVRQATSEYWQAVQARCRETGTLLILDEIQTGFGRTGTFWAYQRLGIRPDILLTAKGMGGGFPLGGFLARREVMQALMHKPILGHITTFGGHPVSCAASLAALKAIQTKEVLGQVLRKETLFREHLLAYSRFQEIRSSGLLMAVELGSFEAVLALAEAALRNSVLTDWFLFCDTAFRLAPPLTITDDEIREGCRALIAAGQEVLS